MRILILGSGAGGGVPQWNCGCANCWAARRHPRSLPCRTQSSVAVSADGKRWLLLNASPDLRVQLSSFPLLAAPKGRLRGSPIHAVVLTDGEMDHVTGLLSLREQKELRLVSSPAVKELLTRQFALLPALESYCAVQYSRFPFQTASLRVAAVDLSGKTPLYARRQSRRGDVVGLRIEAARSRKAFVYLPCLPVITDTVSEFVASGDCVLVDGTFWSNGEMTSLGITKQTARDMGHVPISGRDGSLAWLRGFNVQRKVYVHINNTNPILRKDSRQRNAVERTGIEIAFDGMDIRL